MIDLNKSMFALKKMIKASDTSVLNQDEAINFMRELIIYARDNNIENIEKYCRNVISKLARRKPTATLIHDLECIQHFLLRKKEMRQMMKKREAAARHYCFCSARKEKKQNHVLKMYDVVCVPTQGGFHYSIVTEINNDNIACYPITTASPKKLALIGCKYYPIGQHTEDGLPLYITSSKTTIPYEMAAKCYVRNFENPMVICDALNAFLN